MKLTVQGRTVNSADLEQIRRLLVENPAWSRRKLSQVLCERWGWRNEMGQWKDMASRSLLGKLHSRGLIQLPVRRQEPSNRMRQSGATVLFHEEPPVRCSLAELGLLIVAEVSRDLAQRRQVAAALRSHHYLGFAGAVGENLQYTVRDGSGRLLACVVFGAAAWTCQDRDEFIGWTVEQRRRHLHQVVNNSRFLILPSVVVRDLASWILGTIGRRLSWDWQAKYGHGVDLVETFVEQGRFQGTAYRAANWIKVGQTTGRTRQDRQRRIQAPCKDIYLYPLHRQFRAWLRT
jgi:hypothetical protein